MSINFSHSNPLSTANACYPEDLFLAVNAEHNWNEHSLYWTETILVEWVADALNAPDNREGRDELCQLIKRIMVIQNQEDQAENMRIPVHHAYLRWTGLMSVLEADAHREYSHNPAQVEARPYMLSLKALLLKINTPLNVSSLPSLLSLSESSVNQLLSLAQAAGLIYRAKRNGLWLVIPSGRWSKSN